ncbi:MAG: 3-oxoacyl-[acyl-carrier-protein] synthase III C-terminal domain-containing protein, partial [Myxococcota bacterium]
KRAALEALQRAKVTPSSVDGLLVSSAVPDNLVLPNAPLVHQLLELPIQCLSLNLDSAANSFLHQLILADALLKSGTCSRLLLVQSCLMSRLSDTDDPTGSWWGDGASAAVVELQQGELGVHSIANATYGSFYDAAMAGVPDRDWFDEGRVVWRVNNPDTGRRMMLNIADMAESVVSESLRQAGIERTRVNFFGGYQGASWLQDCCQRACGLEQAKTADIYPTTGMLGPSQLPMALHFAEERGVLSVGDVAVLFSGGSGVTVSSATLIWGYR